MEICPSQVSKQEIDEPVLWMAVIKNEIEFALRGDAEALRWLSGIKEPDFVEGEDVDFEQACDLADVDIVEVRRITKRRLNEKGINVLW